MDNIDPHIAYLMKEEILRNVMRVHAAVLVEGWPGTGKTVTALKATRGMGTVHYYSSGTPDRCPAPEQTNEQAVRIAGLGRSEGQGAEGAAPGVLIIDDADKLDAAALKLVAALLAARAGDRKILLIMPVALGAKELLPAINAVVRFKQHTAEMLLSTLNEP